MTGRYILFWFALALLATMNGVLREATYGKILPELISHQISTGTGILLTGVFGWYLSRHWPLVSSGQAWRIGFVWFILTIAFEFGFGHYVVGHSWAILVNDYNVLEGRVWSLFLVWVLIMPFVFHKYAQRAG